MHSLAVVEDDSTVGPAVVVGLAEVGEDSHTNSLQSSLVTEGKGIAVDHSKYVGDVLHAKLLALGRPEFQEAFHINTEVLLLLLIKALHVVLQVINRDQAVL